MNTVLTSTAIIRGRGQLTIPDAMREFLSWAKENNVISVKATSDNKLVLEPFTATQEVDWKKLRRQLIRVANYTGKRGNLSQFVIEDRERH